MNDNVMGGRGECRHCGEVVNNVAYHEANACGRNPSSLRADAERHIATMESHGVFDGNLNADTISLLRRLLADMGEREAVACRHRHSGELLMAKPIGGGLWSFTPVRKDGHRKGHRHGRVPWTGAWTEDYVDCRRLQDMEDALKDISSMASVTWDHGGRFYTTFQRIKEAADRALAKIGVGNR